MAMDWQVFCKDTLDGNVLAGCFGHGQDTTYLDWLLQAWGWTVSVSLTALVVALCPPGALYLSGGDVAIAVAHALGATGFQIRGRVAECVPYGHFLGGRWSRPVMTKAGGFGTDTTLLHVVNFIEEKLSV